MQSEGEDRNRQVSTYICHGSAAATVFPKKLGRCVSERTASTARSVVKKFASISAVRKKIISANNCHTNDFQHKNFPIIQCPTDMKSGAPEAHTDHHESHMAYHHCQ